MNHKTGTHQSPARRSRGLGLAGLAGCMSLILTVAMLAGCDAVGNPGDGVERPLPGDTGQAGLSCWDLNGNRLADPEEDINGDGAVDVYDCRGVPGEPGSPGASGSDGEDGANGTSGPTGLSCWDLNTNGVGDPEEDINGDGQFNALDCQGSDGHGGANGSAGPAGPSGSPGAQGTPGATGPAGLSCWDLNGNGVADPDEDVNSDGVFDVADCRPGPQGPAGEPGPPGLSCWDINTNGIADPEEDMNSDGVVNLADCHTGVPGPKGDQGPAGDQGLRGVSCWDLNTNGVADPEEDINTDGVVDTMDCMGPAGPEGPQGIPGPPGDGGGLSESAADGRYWMLGGNNGTDPSTQFIGTTDETALHVGVNGVAAMRIEPNSESPNILSGHSSNSAGDTIVGATITGGGNDSTDAGEGPNSVGGDYATVVGGLDNAAGGVASVVAGGQSNTASGDHGMAAGYRAKSLHPGAYVWADTQDEDYASQRANQYAVRANGGVRMDVNIDQFVEVRVAGNKLINTSNGAYLSSGGIWTNASDRNFKTNLVGVDRQAVLAALAAMPIYTWNHVNEDGDITHMGPMAQDFWDAFGLGADNQHIGTIDADGVSLTAIQALYEIIQTQQQTIETQKQELSELQSTIAPMKLQMSVLQARVEQMQQ